MGTEQTAGRMERGFVRAEERPSLLLAHHGHDTARDDLCQMLHRRHHHVEPGRGVANRAPTSGIVVAKQQGIACPPGVVRVWNRLHRLLGIPTDG